MSVKLVMRESYSIYPMRLPIKIVTPSTSRKVSLDAPFRSGGIVGQAIRSIGTYRWLETKLVSRENATDAVTFANHSAAIGSGGSEDRSLYRLMMSRPC
jgi:hypothetical protein